MVIKLFNYLFYTISAVVLHNKRGSAASKPSNFHEYILPNLLFNTNSTQPSMDIKPLPPSFLGIYNLSPSDLGCNAPYMVNSFLVFLFITFSSLFLQQANAAEYLNRDTAQVLTPRTQFPPFSFDFKTFLKLLICSFKTFNFTF